ncbi:endolytic transglycosylase MltG [Shewanella psychrotolerans]|uniref:endolytic transglycosylase MltG n=1 Tax=Shewanella psychrotolerans TaxID=2864206 RepID=UPI001C657092|nr:endolytic transglycosylase MltG [Shewanella psychrotolerans]QYK00146.1 endolytic transglycosylase MltG [Shewanella psychrotolerans]
MKKRFISIISVLLSSLCIASVGLFWGYQSVLSYSQNPLTLDSAQELEVKRGTSFMQMASGLEQRGVIADTWKLKVLIKLHPELAQIRSGLYLMTPDDTISSLLDKLTQGREMVFSVTLIEGQTIKEWSAVLQQLPRIKWQNDVFNQVLLDHGDTSGLPEGKFYPDTYHYGAGDDIKVIVEQSYLKMQSELEKVWQKRDTSIPLSSPYELLIMASIIEKETGKASERPWISAVFTNRLRKKMRLQTDPTVIYGMGDRYQGNITRKDLRQMTPYNTYRINGLTPTPIAAPSGASLQAAAHPAAVDYLYFVSKNDGSHIFSKTLTEHNRAVDKYQRNR